MLTVQTKVSAVSEADRRVVQAMIPVGNLSPGSYVARAVVYVAGQPVRRLIAAFRVAAR